MRHQTLLSARQLQCLAYPLHLAEDGGAVAGEEKRGFAGFVAFGLFGAEGRLEGMCPGLESWKGLWYVVGAVMGQFAYENLADEQVVLVYAEDEVLERIEAGRGELRVAENVLDEGHGDGLVNPGLAKDAADLLVFERSLQGIERAYVDMRQPLVRGQLPPSLAARQRIGTRPQSRHHLPQRVLDLDRLFQIDLPA